MKLFYEGYVGLVYYILNSNLEICNVGSEPQKATDDPGEGKYIVLAYCMKREGKGDRRRMPAPVVDARVLRWQDRLGRLIGAPRDVVARCCLVARAEDSRGASSFEVENGTTMRRRRVAQHPNNRDSE